MENAIILFAHGARDPEWAAPMRAVQMNIRQRVSTSVRVELAFLEFMAPDLNACVTEVVAAGAKQILILPMFIARGGHLKHELPAMIEQLRSTWPTVEFSLSGPVGEQPSVIDAMAEAAIVMSGVNLA